MSNDSEFYEGLVDNSEKIEAPVFTQEPGSGSESSEDPGAKTYVAGADLIGDMVVEDDSDGDSEESLFSPEERLNFLADTILSACFGDKSIRRHALDRLMMLPSPSIFRNENFVLFSVLYGYRSRLRFISVDEEFIRLCLNRNRKILLNNKNLIDINAYGDVDGSEVLGYIGGVIKHYRRLRGMDDLSEVEFETALEKYLIEFKSIECSKALQQAKTILLESMSIKGKVLFGFEDSMNYVRRRQAEIEGLVSMSNGSGFSTAREMLLEEKEPKKSYKIADFGKMEALNKIYGGIYTGMFYQVIAPPKTGKSKFVARCAHTCSVVYGNNVSIWAIEGGKEAFLAQLRAIHFDYIYNTGVDITQKKYGVSQGVILQGMFPNDELRQLEMSSKLDLATNQDYGSVDFIDRPFEVETFLDDIDTSIKSNNSKMLVIDYLQLIGSCKNMPERERVAEAYRSLLAYCKTNNIAVLTPGQYKQGSIDKLVEMKDVADAEMRTAGGSTSEVIRTPDIIFAFWASTQDLLNNKLELLSIPCRFSKPFPPIEVAINLETCQFISVDD